MVNKGKVAIIGSGQIGHSFAIMFAAAGHTVCLCDVTQQRLDTCTQWIEATLRQLCVEGLSRSDEAIEVVMGRIETTTDMELCLRGAVYVQEAIPEDLEMKQSLFAKIDGHMTSDATVLASSTSLMLPSVLFANVKRRRQCLVVHPVSPPVYCHAIELVPSPWTDNSITHTAAAFIEHIGVRPIVFHKEIIGFGINRLQYAFMTEAWRLTVVDDVIGVADLERLVVNGLGNRYALSGPLGAQHVNVDGGITGHNRTYGRGMADVCADFGPSPDVTEPDAFAKMQCELGKLFPEEKTEEFRRYKMKCLSGLAKLKEDLKRGVKPPPAASSAYETSYTGNQPVGTKENGGKIAIIGSGMIGHSYALMFAAAGYNVCIHDINGDMLAAAIGKIRAALTLLEEQGLAKSSEPVGAQLSRIGTSLDFDECIAGASFLMECVSERVELKRAVFERIDAALQGDHVLVASSTSTIRPSTFMEGLVHNSQYLVCHPVSPPIYMPAVEIVPSPWTSEATVNKMRALVEHIGQVPAVLKREISGFVHNRLQYALMAEAWRLAADGVMSADDADTLVADGLGMRWAFIGPWENAMHNAYTGLRVYCHKFAAGIRQVAETQRRVPDFLDAAHMRMMQAQLEKRWPLSQMEEIRQWRSDALARLLKLKMQLNAEHPLS